MISLLNAKTRGTKNVDEILEVIQDIIKPIEYLPYNDKVLLATTTIKQCSNMENKTAMIYRLFIINLIQAYTNLQLDVEDFDLLCKNKLLAPIISLFQSEYTVCDSVLKMCMNDMMESG